MSTPGVAINPLTPLVALELALPHLDFVLLMTVNPGFSGLHFISEMVEKLRALNRMRSEQHVFEIAVDGGVSPANAQLLRAAGADTLIAGSAFFGAEDRCRAVRVLSGKDHE